MNDEQTKQISAFVAAIRPVLEYAIEITADEMGMGNVSGRLLVAATVLSAAMNAIRQCARELGRDEEEQVVEMVEAAFEYILGRRVPKTAWRAILRALDEQRRSN